MGKLFPGGALIHICVYTHIYIYIYIYILPPPRKGGPRIDWAARGKPGLTARNGSRYLIHLGGHPGLPTSQSQELRGGGKHFGHQRRGTKNPKCWVCWPAAQPLRQLRAGKKVLLIERAGTEVLWLLWFFHFSQRPAANWEGARLPCPRGGSLGPLLCIQS